MKQVTNEFINKAYYLDTTRLDDTGKLAVAVAINTQMHSISVFATSDNLGQFAASLAQKALEKLYRHKKTTKKQQALVKKAYKKLFNILLVPVQKAVK